MTISRDELKAVMYEIFDERSHIDAASHYDHHEWIRERIEAEKARKAMFWEIAKSVAQWSVLGLLGGLMYWLQNGHWPH